MDSKLIGDVLQRKRAAEIIGNNTGSKLSQVCSKLMILTTIVGTTVFGVTALATGCRDLKNCFNQQEEGQGPRRERKDCMGSYGNNRRR